ncbi:hypothetical protein VNI00_014309 [Paramarasmius palmivorus]|uniref:Shugoshin C-terminal domain-containing protein n=1 Tax=Paramarasmius palmivorus TaxID=297713 RepID=A0AAW0BWC3_9AGAR
MSLLLLMLKLIKRVALALDVATHKYNQSTHAVQTAMVRWNATTDAYSELETEMQGKRSTLAGQKRLQAADKERTSAKALLEKAENENRRRKMEVMKLNDRLAQAYEHEGIDPLEGPSKRNAMPAIDRLSDLSALTEEEDLEVLPAPPETPGPLDDLLEEVSNLDRSAPSVEEVLGPMPRRRVQSMSKPAAVVSEGITVNHLSATTAMSKKLTPPPQSALTSTPRSGNAAADLPVPTNGTSDDSHPTDPAPEELVEPSLEAPANGQYDVPPHLLFDSPLANARLSHSQTPANNRPDDNLPKSRSASASLRNSSTKNTRKKQPKHGHQADGSSDGKSEPPSKRVRGKFVLRKNSNVAKSADNQESIGTENSKLVKRARPSDGSSEDIVHPPKKRHREHPSEEQEQRDNQSQSNADEDSDFELLPPVLQRLQRKRMQRISSESEGQDEIDSNGNYADREAVNKKPTATKPPAAAELQLLSRTVIGTGFERVQDKDLSKSAR